MIENSKYIITEDATIIDALRCLDYIAKVPNSPLCLFMIDEKKHLKGVITNGDIRRGIISGISLEDKAINVINDHFAYIKQNDISFDVIKEVKQKKIPVVPVVDDDFNILRLIDFNAQKSLLPIDAVVMAGGKGMRLRPFTQNTPKPLLKMGKKAVIDYNLDRMKLYGIEDFHISVNYLADQIIEHLKNGSDREIKIEYLQEDKPLGTAGSISLVKEFKNDNILITNSDIITNIDYEDFYNSFVSEDADMTIACTHYIRNIPYAVLETQGSKVLSYKEKPSYNYISNAGIYLIKKEMVDLIPKDSFFNMTDLIDVLLEKGRKVTYYSIYGYWMDIGNMEDYAKAQVDIERVEINV